MSGSDLEEGVDAIRKQKALRDAGYTTHECREPFEEGWAVGRRHRKTADTKKRLREFNKEHDKPRSPDCKKAFREGYARSVGVEKEQ